jgi:hypothetical protein
VEEGGMIATDRFRKCACDGKKAFATFSEAKLAADRRKGRNVYHCQFCNRFHVGAVQDKKDFRRELFTKAELVDEIKS